MESSQRRTLAIKVRTMTKLKICRIVHTNIHRQVHTNSSNDVLKAYTIAES